MTVDIGLYWMKEARIKRVGNLFGATGGSFAGNIYDSRGLCPTINCSGGGWREPMIIEVYEDTASDEQGVCRG